jgi:hypothetical protein
MKIKILLFLGFVPTVLAAQVSVHGSFGASTEFYKFNSTDSTLRPRRPDFNYRVFFSPVLQIGKGFEMPFTFEITKPLTQAYLPVPSFDSPIRNFTNPNNNIGLHPTFGWATFHLGSHTAQFSELSTGNLPIFGAGFDLNPGRLRMAYSYGVSQWAIRPDTTLRLDGAYERHFQAVKLGVGKKQGSGFYLNAAKIKDFTNSLDGSPKIKGQEGIVFTADFRLKFSSHVALTGEAGASGFTKNIQSNKVDTGILGKLPNDIFNPRITTRGDFAGKASFDIDYEKFGISFNAKYLGAGFEPIGYGFVETDVLDLTVSPRFNLFKNKFMLNGSIGLREDNLAKTKITTTKRLIGSGNMTAVLSEKLSISANYSNYGTRNTLDNDTLRLEFVAQNFSISPAYRFKLGRVQNTLSATYSESQFDDKNLFSGVRNSNNMTAITANWMLVFGKMTLSALGSISRNERSSGQLDIQTYSLQPSIALFKRKLNMSCGLVYSFIEQTGFTADDRIMLRPNVRWQATKRTQLRADGSWQVYHYGSVRRNAQYDESFLRTGIVQSF